MKVLIIFTHPNPLSFTRAVLDNFTRGLKDAGHDYEVVDLYKIRFNPVFQDMDYSFFVDENLPKDLFEQMNLRKIIVELAGGPLKRWNMSIFMRSSPCRMKRGKNTWRSLI